VITLTKADHGRVVQLRLGDAISLELPDNPAAGYQWAIDGREDAALTAASSEFKPSGAGVGGGGIETWTLTARAAGRTALMLKCWRPWEGESSVVDRFAVTIEVAAARP
jgi:inhibitor of cysteine peptidase